LAQVKKIIRTVLILLLLVNFLVLPVSAQQGGTTRDPQVEQKIYDRLAKINPDAVAVFKAATEAMDRGQPALAKAGFEKVLELAPDFPDALRRLSYIEASNKDFQNAESHARQALAGDPSPENQTGLALVLFDMNDQAKLNEALDLAKAAVKSQPDVVYNYHILIAIAAQMNDMTSLRDANQRLMAIAPTDPVGHYMAGLIAADDRQWEKAESELMLAEKYGYPAADIADLIKTSGIHNQALISRGLRLGGIALLSWLAGIGLLFVCGLFLSRATLQTVGREISTGQYEVTPREQFIRRIYRLVIWIASAYFYISLPILIVIIASLVGGVIYVFKTMGAIPANLAIIVVLAGVYTLVAIVRSLFVRVKHDDPGRPVKADEMPELWQLVHNVAERLDTRPVDAIYLSPGVEIAVTERGSLISKMRNKSQRVLILGLGALAGLTQGELQGILAHEYGHFNNRDTAGGDFANQVRYSIYIIGLGLASTGQATWYNPAWWFVNGYSKIFLRITLGASRLQEILADRFAAMAYGIRNLTGGLNHLIRQAVEFDQQVGAEVKQAQAQQRGLNNLYALPPVQDTGLVNKKLAEIMARSSTPYDSHPAPQERLALIEQVKTSGFFDENQHPAWDLIPDAAMLQESITREIEANLRKRDILK
jgi:Zn-dependent protease with chaperone function